MERGATHRPREISRIVAGGLFALFCAFVIAALAVFGVINMTLGHIFLFLAFAVGAVLISTEIIPGKPTKHKIAWIAVLACAMLVFDRVAVGLRPGVSRGDAPSAFLTEWLAGWPTQCVLYIAGLPWRWIVPSLGIGALATAIVAVLRERRRRHLVCPDQRLHEIRIGDKDEIKNLVKVCGVLCRKMAEGREPVHLDSTFSILNMSLYCISVDSIDGFITFHESGNAYKPKIGPRLEKNEARHRTFRQTGCFVVQQDFLTEAEADYVLNAPIDTIFSLKSLKITVTGEGLDPTLLNTDIMVKKDTSWLDYDESYFFSSGIAAQNASVKTDKQLKAQLKGVREMKGPIVTPDPEANIVVCLDDDDNYFRIGLDERKTFRDLSGSAAIKTALRTVVVQFRNEPKPPQKVGRATDVTANILYYSEPEQPHIVDLRTDQPYWINEPSPFVSFDVEKSHRLILGVFRRLEDGGYNFQIYDRSEPDNFGMSCAGANLWFKIVTKLSWGEHHEFGIEKTFELAIEFGERIRIFELFYLPGEIDEKGQPVKISRGRADLR